MPTRARRTESLPVHISSKHATLFRSTAPLSPPNSTEGVPLLGVGKTGSPPDSATPTSSSAGVTRGAHCLRLNAPEACGSLVHNREQWHTFVGAIAMKVALSNLGLPKIGRQPFVYSPLGLLGHLVTPPVIEETEAYSFGLLVVKSVDR